MTAADQVLRVWLLVEVHLGEVTEAAGSEIIPASRYGSDPEPDPNPYQVGWTAPAQTRTRSLAPARTPARCVEAHHEEIAQALRLVARVQ
eukprot:scaffold6024_cov44-Phaeocystis_antarctica.AAC.2